MIFLCIDIKSYKLVIRMPLLCSNKDTQKRCKMTLSIDYTKDIVAGKVRNASPNAKSYYFYSFISVSSQRVMTY